MIFCEKVRKRSQNHTHHSFISVQLFPVVLHLKSKFSQPSFFVVYYFNTALYVSSVLNEYSKLI